MIDPIIFKDLKSLTLADSQQQSLLRLALEGISVGHHLRGLEGNLLTDVVRYIAPTPPWMQHLEV